MGSKQSVDRRKHQKVIFEFECRVLPQGKDSILPSLTETRGFSFKESFG
jgi:hypothetical protein